MNKSKKIAIICVIITAVALVACSVFAYLYFSQKTEKVHDKESGTISETDNNKTVIDATDGEKNAAESLGGTEYILQPTNMDEKLHDADFDNAMAVLRLRLDAHGYAEATVMKHGEKRIKVVIPDNGVAADEELLGRTAALTFRDSQGNVLVKGSDIKDAYAEKTTINGDEEAYVVNLIFTETGAKHFAKATRENIGSNIGIYLDEVLISSPTVNEEIPDGNCVISGSFETMEDANIFASQIKGGMLPFSLELFEKRTFSEKQ